MIEGSIRCTDRNSIINTFYYKYSMNYLTNVEYKMIIFASENFNDPDFFELVAKEVNDSTIKIISINKNNEKLYGAKGIPDAAIPELVSLSGKRVVSSSQNQPTESAEYRTPAATKVWDRLVASGKAVYDANTDRYEYT